MNKKFKDVKNVLNMKKIVSAAIVVGTLFGSTSAFASGVNQSQDTSKYSFQNKIGSIGSNLPKPK